MLYRLISSYCCLLASVDIYASPTHRKQVQEFTLNKQLELEKQLTSASTRATLAEEQMEEMQKYMAQSTASYQKVRPRVLGDCGFSCRGMTPSNVQYLSCRR